MISEISRECRKYVLGALYQDFEGTLYGFDQKGDHLCLSYKANQFMLQHKTELERLNYYSWAKFLEKINDDDKLIHLLGNLEASTPRRNDLSVYREILRREFEECNCFYCGRKMERSMHVDHLIPWSFVKDDKLWNFVLACPSCNERKNNRVPSMKYLVKLEERNKILCKSQDVVIQMEFKAYEEDTLPNLWKYAKASGIKEYAPIG